MDYNKGKEMFNGNQSVIQTANESHPYIGGSFNEDIPLHNTVPDVQFRDETFANDVREGRPFNIQIEFLKHADFSEDKSTRTPFSRVFVTEVTSKVFKNLSSDMLDGTLYSPKMGSLPASIAKDSMSRECATCHTKSCTGHFGKITFPELILNPYANLVNELIDILSCLCLECQVLLIPPDVLREKGIESVPKHLRIKKIVEWSSGQSVVCQSGGKQCKKKKYLKRPSLEDGVITYEEGGVNVTRTAEQINNLLRDLTVETKSLLGFDDPTDFDKYTLVGIAVPPIHIRLPIVTKNGIAPHPFTIALSEIVGLRNEWATSLQNNAFKAELEEYGINTMQIPTTTELSNEMAKLNSQITDKMAQITQKEKRIKTELPELRASLLDLETELAEAKAEGDKTRVSKLTRSLNQTRTSISRLQTTEEKVDLENMRALMNTLRRQKEFLQENQHRLALTGASRVFVSAGDARTNMKKLYVAVAAHFKESGALFQSKKGIIRSGIASKRADFTARAVIVPNTQSRLDTLEIPEWIAKKAGIIDVVTDTNIRRYTIALRQGRITFIESVRSNGRVDRTAVTQSAIARGHCRIRVGDTITRWLMDGDIVIAGRNPSLHPGNIMAFYARITPYNVIGVPFATVTPYAGDFDGDEMHLSIPQTQAAQREAEELMLVTRNIMGVRTGTPIIGVIYNALKNWHVITATTQIFSESLVNDAIYDTISHIPDEDISMIPNIEEWKRRCSLHNISWRSGNGLFSWLLPPTLEFPPGASRGMKSPGGIRIMNGVLLEGVITDVEISANKSGTIVHYLKRHYYDYNTVALFVQKAFRLGDFMGRFFPLTMSARDCSLDQCGVERSAFTSRVEEAMRDMANLGNEPTDPYEKVVYEQSLANINQELMEENRELYEKMASLSSISAEERLQLRELRQQETSLTKQIADLPTVMEPGVEYETELLRLIDEREAIRRQIPLRFHDIDEGLLNQFYLGISAGTKGSKAEFGEMLGVIGQLTMEEGRIELDTSCKTRCLTSFRVGEHDPRARGFIPTNFETGLRPEEKFLAHKVQRVGAYSTAISTPESGAIQRELSTSLGKYYTENSCLVSQTNYLLQYLVGEDGFSSSETFPLYGVGVPFDPMAVADIVNAELGWHRLEDGHWYHEHVVDGEVYYVRY